MKIEEVIIVACNNYLYLGASTYFTVIEPDFEELDPEDSLPILDPTKRVLLNAGAEKVEEQRAFYPLSQEAAQGKSNFAKEGSICRYRFSWDSTLTEDDVRLNRFVNAVIDEILEREDRMFDLDDECDEETRAFLDNAIHTIIREAFVAKENIEKLKVENSDDDDIDEGFSWRPFTIETPEKYRYETSDVYALTNELLTIRESCLGIKDEAYKATVVSQEKVRRHVGVLTEYYRDIGSESLEIDGATTVDEIHNFLTRCKGWMVLTVEQVDCKRISKRNQIFDLAKKTVSGAFEISVTTQTRYTIPEWFPNRPRTIEYLSKLENLDLYDHPAQYHELTLAELCQDLRSREENEKISKIEHVFYGCPKSTQRTPITAEGCTVATTYTFRFKEEEQKKIDQFVERLDQYNAWEILEEKKND